MDEWQFSGNKTSGLQLGSGRPAPARPTAPVPGLAQPTPGPTERGRLDAEARKLVGVIEERMELLWRACGAASCPVPGVAGLPLRHPLSPTGERFVAYLAPQLVPGHPLGRAVPVALFRYREVGDAVLHFGPPPPPEPLSDGALRRGLFFLGNLHAEFKGDRALARLFPPPRTVDYVIPDAPPPMPGGAGDDRLRARRAVEEAVRKSAELAQQLAPKMAVLVIAIEKARTSVVSQPSDLFTPEGRQATRLALELATYPALVPALEEALEAFRRLEALLPTGPLPPGFDPAPLRDLALPLGQLPVVFRNNPLLQAFFAPPAPKPVARPVPPAAPGAPVVIPPPPAKPAQRPTPGNPGGTPRTRPPMSPTG